MAGTSKLWWEVPIVVWLLCKDMRYRRVEGEDTGVYSLELLADIGGGGGGSRGWE